MVKVYYERGGYAQLVALFDNEDTYNVCIDALMADAEKAGMIVTESIVDEISLSETSDDAEKKYWDARAQPDTVKKLTVKEGTYGSSNAPCVWLFDETNRRAKFILKDGDYQEMVEREVKAYIESGYVVLNETIK